VFDNHVHCHEFPREELEGYVKEWTLACVSDDLQSSRKTLELEGVIKCLGIHPWQVEKAEPGDLEAVLRLIERSEAPCIGEVGLDRRLCRTASTSSGSTSAPSLSWPGSWTSW